MPKGATSSQQSAGREFHEGIHPEVRRGRFPLESRANPVSRGFPRPNSSTKKGSSRELHQSLQPWGCRHPLSHHSPLQMHKIAHHPKGSQLGGGTQATDSTGEAAESEQADNATQPLRTQGQTPKNPSHVQRAHQQLAICTREFHEGIHPRIRRGRFPLGSRANPVPRGFPGPRSQPKEGALTYSPLQMHKPAHHPKEELTKSSHGGVNQNEGLKNSSGS